MAKIRAEHGRASFRYVKELGGACKREQLSRTAQILSDRKLIAGRVLDYGCGFGFDADQLGWVGYDPYYRQIKPVGKFDTVVCNHVVNVLLRKTRLQLYKEIRELLSEHGVAYISVPRNVPVNGKDGLRRRIQNYVVTNLPSMADLIKKKSFLGSCSMTDDMECFEYYK